MKIHLLSDLHIEGEDFKLEKADADLLVLAGDIGRLDGFQQPILENFLIQCKEMYEDVIYVAGNHEFYNFDMAKGYDILHSMCDSLGINFLQNKEVTINGIIFFGTTLWTDMNMMLAAEDTKRYLRDFSVITFRGNRLEPEDIYYENNLARLHLKHTKANVIITHHVPNKEGIHPKWGLSTGNYGFQNTNLITKGEVWLFGHTHDSSDYYKDGTHFVCNPRGYGRENLNNFDPLKVIEI